MSLLNVRRMRCVRRELNSSDSKLKKSGYKNRVSHNDIIIRKTVSSTVISSRVIGCYLFLSDKQLYADLWEKDRLAKSTRENMETALQIERNKELLKVCLSIRRLTILVAIVI